MTNRSSDLQDLARRIPLPLMWGVFSAVTLYLLAEGSDALSEIQGVSTEGAVLMVGVAAYFLPVVLGIWAIGAVLDSGPPSQSKFAFTAGILYAMGATAATITDNAAAVGSANAMTCSGSAPTTILCFGMRGLSMLFQSYSWQFTLSALLVYGGFALTAYRGVRWWHSSRKTEEI